MGDVFGGIFFLIHRDIFTGISTPRCASALFGKVHVPTSLAFRGHLAP